MNKKTTNIENKSASSEVLLLSIAQNKDKEAFQKLFLYFAPRLKTYFIRSGLKDYLAEELAQNTLSTVWEKAHLYNPDKAAASTWIYTIARNKKIDFFRKNKNNTQELFTNFSYPEQKDFIKPRLTSEDIKEILDKLPDEQKKIIEMAYLDDLSHPQIAKKTGLPLGTVKSRIRLALKKIRDFLKEDEK